MAASSLLALNKYLAKEPAARALQLAGLLRFTVLFLQGIILVKAGVPMAVVGQLELIFFVINFFQFFWQNGSHQAMMSWKCAEEQVQAVGPIFSAMHLQALAAAALVWLVLLVPVDPELDALLTPHNLLAVSGFVFFSIPVHTLHYAFLVRGQYRNILWFAALSQGLQTVLVLAVLLMGHDIPTLLKFLGAYALIRWMVVVMVGRFYKTSLPAWSGIWAFIGFSMPLIFHALNSGIMDYVDGWIISLFYGDETFALYRFGAREVPLNSMLVGGLVSGLVHRFRSGNATDNAVVRTETGRAVRVLLPVSCVLILLSPLLFRWIYNEEFTFSARIFNIYALTIMSRIILSQVYVYFHHANWVLMWSTAGEVVVNIVLSLLLMKYIGLLGIPLATVVAYALQKAVLVTFVRRRYGIAFSEYVPVKTCFWYFSAMIACVLFSELIFF